VGIEKKIGQFIEVPLLVKRPFSTRTFWTTSGSMEQPTKPSSCKPKSAGLVVGSTHRHRPSSSPHSAALGNTRGSKFGGGGSCAPSQDPIAYDDLWRSEDPDGRKHAHERDGHALLRFADVEVKHSPETRGARSFTAKNSPQSLGACTDGCDDDPIKLAAERGNSLSFQNSC